MSLVPFGTIEKIGILKVLSRPVCFYLSLEDRLTNYFYLAVRQVSCTAGHSLPLTYYEVATSKFAHLTKYDILVPMGKYTHQESAFVQLQSPDA